MAQINDLISTDTNDLLQYTDDGKPIMPTGINVLTILTFIGCGFAFLGSIFAPMIYKYSLSAMDKAQSSGQELSAKQLDSMQKSKAAMELMQQHMLPIIVIGLVCAALCLVGALWMRKYKKDGFWLYTAGEITPLIAGYFILGSAQYTSIWSYVLGIGLPLLFVGLYAMQRKYLTK